MSDIKGVVATTVEEISMNFVTRAGNITQQLSEIAAAIEDTATCFSCPEADNLRNDFDAVMSTSHNIAQNINGYAQDLLKINESYDVFDKKISVSTTDNIGSVQNLSERRVI